MIRVEVDFDKRQLAAIEEELRDIPRTQIDRCLVRSLNRTAAVGQSRAVKRISGDTGLKQKDIRAAVIVRKATSANMVAKITIPPKRFSLMQFNARQTPTGVTYRNKLGRGDIPSAFIAVMPGGHRDVYRRRTGARLPIDKVLGPRLTDFYENAEGIIEEEQAALGEILMKNLRQQVDLMLARRKAAGND